MSTLAPHLGDLMDQTTCTAFAPPEIDQSRLPDIECLCPFCGSFNAGVGKPCVECALEDTDLTRAAATQRVGPWFVLQMRNPSAPGVTFETLQALIRRHVVTPRSVVRGPTTGQLWRLASKVRGISREFGQCYDCGEDVERDEMVCPNCERLQTLPEPTPSHVERHESSLGSASGESASGESATGESGPTNHDLCLPAAASVSNTTASDWKPITLPDDTTPITADPEPITVLSSESADQTPIEAVFGEHPSDRHVPKDDLLTARDVAKAFLLEFSSTTATPDRDIPRRQPFDFRKLKTGLALVALLMLAALVWPVGHVVAGWFQPGPVAVKLSNATPITPVIALTTSHSTPAVARVESPHTKLDYTGRRLDVGISGDGYLQVKIGSEIGDGTGFTRNGSLMIARNGDLMVNIGDGCPLVPPIRTIPGATDVKILTDGTVQCAAPDNGPTTVVGRLQLCRFDHPDGLQPVSGSVFIESAASGPAICGAGGDAHFGQLQSGFLETAMVNLDPRPVLAMDLPQPRAVFQPVMYTQTQPLTPATPAVEPAPTPSSSDDPKLLWSTGMEAESRQDFAAAVSAYEKLESLPSDSWPAHLEVRLELARKGLKGELR